MTRSNAAYFGIGAVAGGAVTAFFFLFKEGILFVGDSIAPKPEERSVDDDVQDDSEEKPIPFTDAQPNGKPDLVAYHAILQNNHYADENIFFISEEDYFEAGRDGDFDMQSFTLYSDGIIADSSSDRVLDARDRYSVFGTLFTTESLIEEFEKGVEILYVRNKRLFTQYEISYDDRSYEGVTGQVAYG